MALHIPTPLIHSLPLSKLAGIPIYLKLELLQPSGSFKDRGMGHLVKTLKARGATHLVSSSGGNAGHSAAHAGRALGMPVKVIVPSTTKKVMLDLIRAQGADVEVYGDNWNAADEKARAMVEADSTAAYISPYDDPLLWEGHSTLVDELVGSGVRPGAIVASVGGGGLLCGIFRGLKRHGWDDVAVIAAETEGAASFAAAFEAGEVRRLSGITSVATSLGALEVTPAALQYAKAQPTRAQVSTITHALPLKKKMLVEPACGAALAVAYIPAKAQSLASFTSVVIVVCGGSGVTVDYLKAWEQQFLSA
ncbi:threonine dehydratase [Tribonema minus]|uniref:L-serine ammonia-lyase n=1 Tax=Tribonema minus TaxID=303371 RepID=A0A835ZB72_9STRA|nr:threonine dehydratase [Tribonema minus]